MYTPLDFVVGNLGLNYKYKASQDKPFRIHAGDLDNNGNHDIVLGYFNQGALYPVRGLQCSSQQIPGIKDKFKSYEAFGSATLVDVYGKKNLENAMTLNATNFASSYLENMGNGNFKLFQLPPEAQFSSVNDILVGDYNYDGHLDAIIGGNLHASEVETTRNDASVGLFLKGNGKGDFMPKPYLKTGLMLRNDVKQLKIVRSQNKTILLVANNNDKLESYAFNQNTSKNH